jgi:predicted nucleotidyltransferase component of viral defense system
MDLQGLKRHKEKTIYTLLQAELDYYQHLIPGKVYEKYNTLYFKGGTALQKCYGIKRFSEDLDFNYTGIDLEMLRGFIEKILNGKTTDHHENKFNTSFTIRFAGILYDGDPRSMC